MMHPIEVNVGGQTFSVRGSVLAKYPDSVLGRALREREYEYKSIYFDRDAEIFELILTFIRYDAVTLDPGDLLRGRMLIKDMEFFGIIPVGPIFLYQSACGFEAKYTWEQFKAKYRIGLASKTNDNDEEWKKAQKLIEWRHCRSQGLEWNN
jgi:hypothetical protein